MRGRKVETLRKVCDTVPDVVVKTPERMKRSALALVHSCGVLR
jgi:hypothetical protein